MVGSPDNQEKQKFSEYEFESFDDSQQFWFRRCAACGDEKMAPNAYFRSRGLAGSTDQGIRYGCSNCGHEVLISNSESLFMGALQTVFWLFVAAFAFYKGLFWYVQYYPIYDGDEPFYFYLFDGLSILLSLAAIGVSFGAIWLLFAKPLRIKMRYPQVAPNREQTSVDKQASAHYLRSVLLSIVVVPFVLWAILLGGMWLLDSAGFDLRGDQLTTYLAMGIFFALVIGAGRKLNLPGHLIFIGMALWMGLIVAGIFSFG